MKSKWKTHRGKPDPAVLADIVERVVRASEPEKIVMFGSAARGEMGPNSDIDLLVIKNRKFNYGNQMDRIERHLRGIRLAGRYRSRLDRRRRALSRLALPRNWSGVERGESRL